jgi:cellulose synthase/poly-beta-1,6-N-acetylglucosamine synthase-like glycosyltransferase
MPVSDGANRLSEAPAGRYEVNRTLPALSILFVTDSLDSISRSLDRYRAQCDPSQVELVIACFGGSDIPAEVFERAGFPNVRTVVSDGMSRDIAEGMAVRAATSDFVLFAQAQSYPRPGFLNALMREVREDRWAVIGPSVQAANPGTTFAWAALWILYGRWVDVRARGAGEVPGHNSAYRRSALLSLGSSLETSLDAGAHLIAELRARGHESFLLPEACMEIVMPATFADFVRRLFRQGRQFAGQRRQHWSIVRRFGYAAGSPFIPLVRIARIFALLRERGHSRAAFIRLPSLLLGLMASAAGESVGYLSGKAEPPSPAVAR